MTPSGPMDVFTLQAEREFRSAVRPIYRNTPLEPRPVQVGSALLLNLGGTPTVVTAAHILRELSQHQCSLYVGGSVGAGLVPIMGGRRLATPGDRVDHMDVAMWQPDEKAVESLGGVEFVGSERLTKDSQPEEGRLYTALGYPVSRNKKAIDHSGRSVTTRVSMYTARASHQPRLAGELGISGTDHLFLELGKHAFTGDGEQMNVFGTQGLSGGALLDLGVFMSDESLYRDPMGNARLAGMVIEYHRPHRVLVAVKIDAVLTLLHAASAG
jgi:hypothetical protein